MNYSILYKGHGSEVANCTCYSWEMALIVDRDVLFDNMQDWKRIQEKARQAYTTYDEPSS
jgi:hypothetical protein